jgi:hypothetical protein
MQEKNKKYNEKEQQIAENRSRNTLFERRENLQKHESYASERRQYDAIRNGQTDRIQSVFQITPDGTPGILSRNELRNSKNMFIAGITLFTHSHVVNGVIIVHSHPFKGQHEHTEVQLETIFYLASFVSSSLPLLPVAATVFLVLLCVLSILTTECIKCVKLRGGICLRAPPSFFQIR